MPPLHVYGLADNAGRDGAGADEAISRPRESHARTSDSDRNRGDDCVSWLLKVLVADVLSVTGIDL
jgi:hypothetical protein